MLQILISFPSTYFLSFDFQIEHFGNLQVLAIYVILGIGADDIFVLYDAFMQAPTFDDTTTGESQDEISIVKTFSMAVDKGSFCNDYNIINYMGSTCCYCFQSNNKY